MSLPTIVFDTSAVNALAKGGSHSEPYIKALGCGFDVWVTAMSVDELISTTDPAKREMLVACCQRLLASGRCVWPPHEIVTLLVSAHARNPSRFDWRQVNVRFRVYERAIIDRDFTNEMCVEQWDQQQHLEQEFMKFWEELRLKLDPILASDPTKRPTSYSQAAEIARLEDHGVLWGIGQQLYGRVSGTTPSDAEIKAFLDVCPPFRAMCYGLCGAWYDGSLRLPIPKKRAGRNDQMMAIYLPYCGRFVTRDRKQGERLREVKVEARLDCEILSYKNFCAGFEAVA